MIRTAFHYPDVAYYALQVNLPYIAERGTIFADFGDGLEICYDRNGRRHKVRDFNGNIAGESVPGTVYLPSELCHITTMFKCVSPEKETTANKPKSVQDAMLPLAKMLHQLVKMLDDAIEAHEGKDK